MSAPWKKQQVSLRGASAKEISRADLLEKVAQERDLRSYNRRASAAALFIQVKVCHDPLPKYEKMREWERDRGQQRIYDRE